MRKEIIIVVACVCATAGTFLAGMVAWGASHDVWFPACRAFSGACDPGLLWRFNAYASVALFGWGVLLLGATAELVGLVRALIQKRRKA